MGGEIPARIDRMGTVRKVVRRQPLHQYRYIESQLSRHRRLEDVTYWRKKAGWYDDDASMKNYNSKAQNNRFFSSDDEAGNSVAKASETLLWNAIGVVVILVSVAFMFFIARAITRKLTAKSKIRESSGEKETEKSSSGRSHRSRTSRARSRSRSRAADESAGTTEYRLMEGESDRRERRKDRSSSRARSSRSSSRRSQSRTRSSSSRRASSSANEPTTVENILV